MSEAADIRRRAAMAALKVIADDLMGRAQREAPVEEGTLRGSATVTIVTTSEMGSAVVSFNTVYAARQHEEVTWKHPKGGKAKYLEDPLKAMAQRYVQALAAAQRKAL